MAIAIGIVFVVMRLRPRLAVPAALAGGLLVAAIAFTRLYLFVHYPSDIVAGWVLGALWAAGAAWLWERPTKASSDGRAPPIAAAQEAG